MIVASLAGDKDPLVDLNLMKWYGSLWETYFTLFTAITDGSDWRQLLVPLEKLSWFYSCVYSIYIAFMKLGAFNVIAAVLIVYVMRHRDCLLQRETFMNQERDHETLKELRELFRLSKKERHGRITEKTCRQVLEDQQGMKRLATLGMTVARVMGLFKMLEADTQNRRDVDELLFLISNSKGEPALMLAAMMRCECTRIVVRVDKLLRLAETRFAQVLQEDPDVLRGKF